MTRKTDGERIDDIEEKVQEQAILQATLGERLNNTRDELKDLKKDLDEARRRLWLIIPPLLAALVSAGLTGLVTYLFRR